MPSPVCLPAVPARPTCCTTTPTSSPTTGCGAPRAATPRPQRGHLADGVLNDFVRRVAFKATTTNLTVAQKANGKIKITAKVAADAKTSTVSPTGRVQFLLDGRAVGEPLELTGKNVRL